MIEADTHHIERCLDGHPHDFRHLIARYQRPLLAHLRRRMGGQPQAIAQCLDLPTGTVTKRLSRAYEQLRVLLQQPG